MATYSRPRIRKETEKCALKYCTCHRKTTKDQVATKRGHREQALAEMREAKAAVAASGGDNYPGCSLCGLPDHKRRVCPSRTTALVPEAAVLAAPLLVDQYDELVAAVVPEQLGASASGYRVGVVRG